MPFRYEDRSRVSAISSLWVDTTVTCQGEVMSISTEYKSRPSKTTIKIRDESGSVSLVFYSMAKKIENEIKKGSFIRVYGKCKRGRYGIEIQNPEYIVLRPNTKCLWDEGYMPIYTSTSGFSFGRLRRVIRSALELLRNSDYHGVLDSESKVTLKDAIFMVHNPNKETPVEKWNEFKTKYQIRLIVDELVAQQISALFRKKSNSVQNSVIVFLNVFSEKKFKDILPFPLTGAQQKAYSEAMSDMTKTHPMVRLIHGDVGSGKTLVAAMIAWQVVSSQMQVVIMAPTEILAEQLTANFKKWLVPLGVTVEMLIKGASKKKNELLNRIKSGDIQIIVGTHALFQDAVEYHSVGLVIIDEQHRFGVEQRLSLIKKATCNGKTPHQLVMTATPIPRTLTMTAFADLDVSTLDEMPPGRTPIKTLVLPVEERNKLASRVLAVINEKKEQVYWVCPLVEESEKKSYAAAETMVLQLHDLLPGARIGMVHGRLNAKEKQDEMEKFVNKELDVLVATTVIEVGVDVPNASLIIIEDAHQLGLAQLHQLRGRVGRGSAASYCVMLYDQSTISEIGRKRLDVLRHTTDGFAVSQADLELRGAGDVLGVKQSGTVDYHIADLQRDERYIHLSSDIANRVLEQTPEAANELAKFWFDEESEFISV